MATQLRLKLQIDRKTNKVLFAEAGTEVVDFLFSLLSLPLGSIIKIITKEKMVGCIGSLYKSAGNLDETYFASNQNKTRLLNPIYSLLNPISKNALFQRKLYRCCNTCVSSTEVYGTLCSCGSKMAYEVVSMARIVKEMVTYTVMDDLTIMPTSAISIVTLLSKFDVNDVRSLEERTVNLGMSEGLKLLEASLQSKTVLNDVFMGRKAAADEAK